MGNHAKGALRGEPGGIEASHSSGHIPDPFETLPLENAGGQAGAMAGAANQSDVAVRIKFDVPGAQHWSRNVERT